MGSPGGKNYETACLIHWGGPWITFIQQLISFVAIPALYSHEITGERNRGVLDQSRQHCKAYIQNQCQSQFLCSVLLCISQTDWELKQNLLRLI